MDRISYNQGDTGIVFVNATVAVSTAKLYLYNETNSIVDSVTAQLFPQNISPANIAAPWQFGFGYSASFYYSISNSLPSGVYNWEGKIFFIVKSSTKNADITIIYPSNTEAAYNNAGGKCFYHNSSTNNVQGDTLSFLRPLTPTELTYNRMYSSPFLKWLRQINSYNVQYICDQDVDDYSEIQNSKIICVIGHSEYWTRAARLNFDQFVNSGKDAVVLSGNTMWWQARYHSTDKTRIICYKSYSDPISNPLLKTVNWTDASLNYSVLKSIGVDWLHGAYPPSTIPGAYHGWGGYKIMLPNSPLLAGTGLNFNDTLSCTTREYDGTLCYGVNDQGDPVLDTTSLGFCKIELIGYDYGQEDFHSSPTKGYGTFIAFKKSLSSGNIINVAGTQWCANTTAYGYPGGFGGPDSSIIQKIIRNIFDISLAKGNIFSNPAPNCQPTTSTCCNISKIHVKIFPNPSSGKFFISRESADTTFFKIEAYNVIGEKCFEDSVYNEFDLTSQDDGIYFVRINTLDGSVIQKVVVGN